MFTKRFIVRMMALSVAAMMVLSADALAQRGGGRQPPPRGSRIRVSPPPPARPPVRQVRPGPTVIIEGGWGYGWGPWGPYGTWIYGWGPWGPWGPWGSPYHEYLFAEARIQVTPKTAEVFVDGYRAGIVDDFDGFFQRLTVWPGEHQITLFLEGYATENHLLYMVQGTTVSLKGPMERLPDGVRSEPPPTPEPSRRRQAVAEPPSPTTPPATPPPAIEVQREVVRFGSVSIKVMPGDAEVVIDEHVWAGPGADQRLNVQLAAGRHHVEVRKEGYVSYVEDILIRAGQTMTLNVGLNRK